MEKCKPFFIKYRHALPLIAYGIVYWLWFCYLEKNVTGHYHVIHMRIDDYIPFCEIFVIPYFLWFVYVSLTVLYLFFTDKRDYFRLCIFLGTGMTIFLVISTLWPNGHHLRMSLLPRKNLFTHMVIALWRTDTPTNLWPSIHVYNALGAHFAIRNNQKLMPRKGIRICSFLLAISIVLSTVMIKQHSVFDVLTAFALAAVMHVAVYRFDLVLTAHKIHRRRKSGPQIVR